MLRPVTALLRSGPGRRSFVRVAAALVVLAVGSGILMSAWAHAVVTTPGYVPSDPLGALLGPYLAGDPSAVWRVVVVSPLLEEVVFRGALLSVLLVFYRPVVAIVGSAVVFGLWHGNLVQLVPALWMGLVLGMVYWRTGSLILCVFGHATYNAQWWVARAVLALPLPPGYSPLPLPGAVGDQPAWWIASGVVLTLSGVFAAGWVLWRMPVPEVAVWRRVVAPVSRRGASASTPMAAPSTDAG